MEYCKRNKLSNQVAIMASSLLAIAVLSIGIVYLASSSPVKSNSNNNISNNDLKNNSSSFLRSSYSYEREKDEEVNPIVKDVSSETLNRAKDDGANDSSEQENSIEIGDDGDSSCKILMGKRSREFLRSRKEARIVKLEENGSNETNSTNIDTLCSLFLYSGSHFDPGSVVKVDNGSGRDVNRRIRSLTTVKSMRTVGNCAWRLKIRKSSSCRGNNVGKYFIVLGNSSCPQSSDWKLRPKCITAAYRVK